MKANTGISFHSWYRESTIHTLDIIKYTVKKMRLNFLSPICLTVLHYTLQHLNEWCWLNFCRKTCFLNDNVNIITAFNLRTYHYLFHTTSIFFLSRCKFLWSKNSPTLRPCISRTAKFHNNPVLCLYWIVVKFVPDRLSGAWDIWSQSWWIFRP